MQNMHQHDSNTRIIFYHKYFKRNQIDLLKLIKRKKTFLKNKKDKNSKEYKDLEELKGEFERLQNKYSQYEEFINKMVVQNSKIVEDNKFLCLEMLKAQKNAEIKTEKMIFFILTFLNKVQNAKQWQNVLHQQDQSGLESPSQPQSEIQQNLELVQYNQQQQDKMIKNIEQYLQSINNQQHLSPHIENEKLHQMLQKYTSNKNNQAISRRNDVDIFNNILNNCQDIQKEINVVKEKQKELQKMRRKNSEGFVKLDDNSKSSRKNSLQLSRKQSSLFGQFDDKNQESVLFGKLDSVEND